MKEDPHPPMSKILAFGYAREWQDERDKWLASQRENQNADRKKTDSRGNAKKSEYQSSMAARTPPVRNSAKSRHTSAGSYKQAGV